MNGKEAARVSQENFITSYWLRAATALAVLYVGTASAAVTSIYSFSGPDGSYPAAALVQAGNGEFLGVTNEGGASDIGSIFEIDTNGVLQTLHSFLGAGDGGGPKGSLTLGHDGNYYSVNWGRTDKGNIFRMTPSGSVTIVYSFSGPDGFGPATPLVLGTDGNFYGATYYGGSRYSANNRGYGTVFKMSADGTVTTLHSFTGRANGASPNQNLVEGADGSFYGTTSGSSTNYGTIFKITPAGVFTTLVTFPVTKSLGNKYPGYLTLGPDGDLYGTASGGRHGLGSVFKITAEGKLTVLHAFEGRDGVLPTGPLIIGNDGSFYGVTTTGGAEYRNYVGGGVGTIYKMTPDGALTTLYSFSGGDRVNPAALTLGNDGVFYGVTAKGGTSGLGTIFKMTTTGVPPSPPATVTAVGCWHCVRLKWSAAPGATSYYIYKGTAPGAESSMPVIVNEATRVTVRGLTSGTPYYFKVAPVSSDGIGASSVEVSVTPN